jgi:hypothetical protein
MEESAMKKLLLAVGWLIIAVPALIVLLTIYGVTKFVGQENEMSPRMLPEHRPVRLPAGQGLSSERSKSPSSLAVAG